MSSFEEVVCCQFSVKSAAAVMFALVRSLEGSFNYQLTVSMRPLLSLDE